MSILQRVCTMNWHHMWLSLILTALGSAPVIVAPGCTSPTSNDPRGPTTALTDGSQPLAAIDTDRLALGRDASDPVTRLVNRAQAERTVSPPLNLAPPPLIESARLTPPQDRNALHRAELTLFDAVAEIRAALSPTPETGQDAGEKPQSPQPLDVEARHKAERLYLQGRQEYLDGKYFDASRRFSQALELDPTSTACVRLLARCSERSAGRAAALTNYRRLLELSPNDAEALLKLGQVAMERRQWGQAVSFLATVIGYSQPPAPEPAPAFDSSGPSEPWAVTLAGLWAGQSLFNLGYDAAGAEAVQRSLETAADRLNLNGGGPLPNSFRTELSELSRARGMTAQHVGDAWMRRGRTDRAWEWYLQARALPDTDGGQILARMVYAQTRLGHPYTTMLTILDALTQPALLEPAVRLVEYVSHIEGSALLGEAIAELLAEQPGSLALSLAAASLLPINQGDRLLEDFITTQPATSVLATMTPIYEWMLRRGERERALNFVIHQAANFTNNWNRSIARDFAARIADPRWIADCAVMKPTADVPAVTVNLMAMILMAGGQHSDAHALLEQYRINAPDQWTTDLTLAVVESLLGQSLTGDAMAVYATLETEDLADDVHRFHTAIELLGHMNRVTQRTQLAQLAAERCRQRAEARGVSPWDVAEDDSDYVSLTDALFTIARLEMARGNVQTAAEILTNITKNVPDDEEAFAMLLSLYGPQGELSDPERFRSLTSTIARQLPVSRLFEMLRARNDLSRGRTDRGLAALRQLAEDRMADPQASELYTVELIRVEQFDQAVNWLKTQREERPGDRNLLDQFVTVLVAGRRYEEALGPLQSWLDSHPLDESAWKSYETILRKLGREDDARTAARNRLNNRPASFETSCAKAENAIAEQSYDQVFMLLDEAMSYVTADEPSRLERVVQTAARLSDEAVRRNDSDLAETSYRYVITTVDQWKQWGFTVTSQAHVWRIDAMIRSGLPYDRVAAGLDEACQDQPDDQVKLTALTIALLQNSNRTDDACQLIDAWLGTDRPFDPQDASLISLRLMLAANRHEPELAVTLVQRAAEVNLLDQIEAVTARAWSDGSLADSLYVLSSRFHDAGDPAGSEYVLEQILGIKPNHAGANNDLGYAWADRGERLDQAERMILSAFDSDPDNVAYLDSLGWLRYKQGRLEDQGADDEQLGAVTLLTRAAGHDEGRDDPVISDHLGDALWRAGRDDDAIVAWKNAMTVYERQLRLAEEYGGDSADRWREVYEDVSQQAAQKIDDALNGQQPRVSVSPGLD